MLSLFAAMESQSNLVLVFLCFCILCVLRAVSRSQRSSNLGRVHFTFLVLFIKSPSPSVESGPRPRSEAPSTPHPAHRHACCKRDTRSPGSWRRPLVVVHINMTLLLHHCGWRLSSVISSWLRLRLVTGRVARHSCNARRWGSRHTGSRRSGGWVVGWVIGAWSAGLHFFYFYFRLGGLVRVVALLRDVEEIIGCFYFIAHRVVTRSQVAERNLVFGFRKVVGHELL